MKISMRAFLKRDQKSGQMTIYGHSRNSDRANRKSFDEYELWEPEADDQHAIVLIDIDLPKPTPVPVVRAGVVTKRRA
jgi:hypothetical protein